MSRGQLAWSFTRNVPGFAGFGEVGLKANRFGVVSDCVSQFASVFAQIYGCLCPGLPLCRARGAVASANWASEI